MADRTMSATVLNVALTTAQWASNDYKDVIIKKGLLCVEFKTDNTSWVKIGDGTHKYAELPYITDGAIGSLGNIFTVKGVVATVQDLPSTGNHVGDVYFVGDSSAAGTDKYSEYVWTSNSSWEFIGQVAAEIPVYTGGTGINIDGNNAINLEPAVGSTTIGGVKAGTNITIAADGTISATADPVVFDSSHPYDESTNPAATVGTVTAAIDALDGSITGSPAASKTVTAFSETNGVVSATFEDIEIPASKVTYDAATVDAALDALGSMITGLGTAASADVASSIVSGSSDLATAGQVADKIASLDGSVSGTPAASKTLTAFSETDGVVSATFGDISITKSQVSDFPTLGTAASKDVASGISSGNNDLATSGQVYAKIGTLDASLTGSPAASKTLTAFSQTDGIVSATFGDIQIAESQVTNLTSDLANKVDVTDTLTLNCTL